MAVFRRKFLAYLEHTLDDRKQLKFFQSIYQQIPQQAIIALVKLRTLPDSSLVRALLETLRRLAGPATLYLDCQAVVWCVHAGKGKEVTAAGPAAAWPPPVFPQAGQQGAFG